MNTSRKILDTVKFKLSDCKDIHKYTSAYQEAYDYVWSLTTDLPTKGASMILQMALPMNMGAEYAGIVSTIESEWKNGTTNLKSTILRLISLRQFGKGAQKSPRSQTKQPSSFLPTRPNRGAYEHQKTPAPIRKALKRA